MDKCELPACDKKETASVAFALVQGGHLFNYVPPTDQRQTHRFYVDLEKLAALEKIIEEVYA